MTWGQSRLTLAPGLAEVSAGDRAAARRGRTRPHNTGPVASHETRTRPPQPGRSVFAATHPAEGSRREPGARLPNSRDSTLHSLSVSEGEIVVSPRRRARSIQSPDPGRSQMTGHFTSYKTGQIMSQHSRRIGTATDSRGRNPLAKLLSQSGADSAMLAVRDMSADGGSAAVDSSSEASRARSARHGIVRDSSGRGP